MYIELIGERVLCVCLVLRAHCTFDGDGGSKLQSRSCLSCVFSIIVSNTVNLVLVRTVKNNYFPLCTN